MVAKDFILNDYFHYKEFIISDLVNTSRVHEYRQVHVQDICVDSITKNYMLQGDFEWILKWITRKRHHSSYIVVIRICDGHNIGMKLCWKGLTIKMKNNGIEKYKSTKQSSKGKILLWVGVGAARKSSIITQVVAHYSTTLNL